ncbi:hypothetical protein TNCV_3260681 [Trichonephila clavipes]|nr:hypothetical protein TNCV_3260681 [Trichonephila clavipes]
MTDTSPCRRKEPTPSESAIAQKLCKTTGRQVPWFYCGREALAKGAIRWLFCTPPPVEKVGHQRHRLQWCREQKMDN